MLLATINDSFFFFDFLCLYINIVLHTVLPQNWAYEYECHALDYFLISSSFYIYIFFRCFPNVFQGWGSLFTSCLADFSFRCKDSFYFLRNNPTRSKILISLLINKIIKILSSFYQPIFFAQKMKIQPTYDFCQITLYGIILYMPFVRKWWKLGFMISNFAFMVKSLKVLNNTLWINKATLLT